MPDDPIPADALLAGYPEPTRALVEHLRDLVRRTFPEAVERVRPGWRLLVYDLPVGRRNAYFAWIMPQLEHIHLGFPYGSSFRDQGRELEGAGITKWARWLTAVKPADIDDARYATFLRLAAAEAGLTKAERIARSFDAEMAPEGR